MAKTIEVATVAVNSAFSSAASPARTAERLLAEARVAVRPALERMVGELPEPLRTMAGYHLGWWDIAGTRAPAAAGKTLRPALVFAAADACGGPMSCQAIAAAGAVELIHNFTLLHDDVMDGDRTRRGRETVWSIWGIPDAILLGDVLHTVAIELLVQNLTPDCSAAAVARLESAVVELCRGQHEDCEFERRAPVDTDEYLRMAMGKTGSLMGAACALGAVSAHADLAVTSTMDVFGREIGVAFQIVDDMLGIWGETAVTGKPTGADLARRKQSLPVVAALQSGTRAGAELAELYGCGQPLTAGQVHRAGALIEESGARTIARTMAGDRMTAALAALPDPTRARDLMTLADLLVRRDR
ncbi:polyprenyl synthetase family protein [Nocardia concava]|uniref:polyprenyl synthetase family protein n=1 Tax=Nocardia concava TaxID=257281 RepID=UPI0006878646|nr:polyprenyl synthetase family protein [Nocardia concava]